VYKKQSISTEEKPFLQGAPGKDMPGERGAFSLRLCGNKIRRAHSLRELQLFLSLITRPLEGVVCGGELTRKGLPIEKGETLEGGRGR